MENTKLPAYPSYEEIAEGNNMIADFMPDMKWNVPPNSNCPPYWQQYDKDGFIRKAFTAGTTKASAEERFVTLAYHSDWNRLKPVVDRIFTYSLAYPDQTETIRKMSIVVDIIPAWMACVQFAVLAKAVLEEANK
jgi:hypothetical protein